MGGEVEEGVETTTVAVERDIANIDTNRGERSDECGIFSRKPVGKTSANVAIKRGAWMAD